jgi:Ca2+-binding EF-hand superfamily protein
LDSRVNDDMKQEIRDLFKAFDEDNSGDVDAGEI